MVFCSLHRLVVAHGLQIAILGKGVRKHKTGLCLPNLDQVLRLRLLRGIHFVVDDLTGEGGFGIGMTALGECTGFAVEFADINACFETVVGVSTQTCTKNRA